MLSLITVLVLATPVCDPSDPSKCSAPLTQGAVAPFAGQLLTPALAVDLGLKAQFCDARIGLEVEHARALVRVDLDLERQLRAIDTLKAAATADVLRQQMDAVSPRVYERPWVVAIVTAIVVVSAYALAMKSVDWINVEK
jgi:hypothetical protein